MKVLIIGIVCIFCVFSVKSMSKEDNLIFEEYKKKYPKFSLTECKIKAEVLAKKKYNLFKKGEDVRINVNGRILEGEFLGVISQRVYIGSSDIMLSFIPKDKIFHFDKKLAEGLQNQFIENYIKEKEKGYRVKKNYDYLEFEKKLRPVKEKSDSTIITLDGKKYTNAVVLSHTASALTIMFDDGCATIPFSNLSLKLKSKYNYSKAKSLVSLQKLADKKLKEAIGKVYKVYLKYGKYFYYYNGKVLDLRIEGSSSNNLKRISSSSIGNYGKFNSKISQVLTNHSFLLSDYYVKDSSDLRGCRFNLKMSQLNFNKIAKNKKNEEKTGRI